MRIAFITPISPSALAVEAAHAARVCSLLAARGHDVHVITREGSTLRGGGTLHAVMPGWRWPALPRLARTLKRCAPDAVYLQYLSWSYDNHPMITAAAALSKAILPRAPFVTQFENVVPRQADRLSSPWRIVRGLSNRAARRPVLDEAFGSLLGSSDRIVVPSDVHGRGLSRLSPGVEAKTILVPPPPLARPAGSRGASRAGEGGPRDFLLAYVGYMYPRKGVEALVDAVAILRRHAPQVRVLLVPVVVPDILPPRRGYAAEIAGRIAGLGLEGSVRWADEVRWDSLELANHLGRAHACLLPHDYGIQLNNRALAAACAQGVPVVAVGGQARERALLHGENILLCPPDCPEALAAAVRSLVEDPVLGRRIAEGALGLAREHYDWDRAIDRIEAALRHASSTASRSDSHQTPSPESRVQLS